MTDYKTLYDAIVNLNIPIEKQGKFANDKDLWFEYAHFPYIGKSNQSDVVDVNIPLTFEAKADDTKIYFLAYNAEQARTIEVSTDNGKTWAEFTSEVYDDDNNTPIATLNIGQKALVRGDNLEADGMGYHSDNAGDHVSAGAFWVDGQAYVYGNIMSLLNSNDFASLTSVPEAAFACQFCDYDERWLNEGSLFSHPTKKLLLPATTIAEYCYCYMFSKCANLTTAPELPVATLAMGCYGYMFSDCTSLTTAPELPATTLADSCYGGMFYGCTSLTAAPELPATTLAYGCYSNMFQGCTSLTTAPELPVRTLAEFCYESMFSGCKSLTTAPELPATTLADGCYNSMFYDCTSLIAAPELPATTLAESCYNGMFSGCKSLTTAPELPATTLANNCYNGMFSGCTSLIAAPELPATTLANSCYNQMFYDCTSLTIAPELPATTLVGYCYANIFLGCTSLNYIKAMFTTTPSDVYAKDWVKNVSPTGTFVKNAEATWNVTGDNGIPTGWTVETA